MDLSQFSDEEIKQLLEQKRASAAAVSTAASSSFGTREKVAEGAGAGFMSRAAMSFATTPEGKQNILNRWLEEGYTSETLPDGSLAVRAPDGQIRRVDPSSPEWADIADIIGDLPPIAGSVVGAIVGTGMAPPFGGIPGAGVGAGTGRAISSGFGRNFMGSEESLEDIALAAGEEALLGAAGEGAVPAARLVGGVGKGALKLTGAARWFRNRGVTSPTAKATREAMEMLGADVSKLPVSAQSEAKIVQLAEQNLRQHPATMTMMQEADEVLRREMLDALERTRDLVLPLPKGKKGLSWPLKSGIAQADVEDALMMEVVAHREHIKELADKAFKELTKDVPPDTPVSLPALTNYLREWKKYLEEFPKANKGPIKNAVELLDDIIGVTPKTSKVPSHLAGPIKEAPKKKGGITTLGQLKRFHTKIGDLIFDHDTYGKEGKRIYRHMMDDFDDLFKDIPGAEQKWAQYRNLWKFNYALDESPLVKLVFGKDEIPNPALIHDAVNKVFKRGSPETIMKFAKRIGAKAGGPEDINFLTVLRQRWGQPVGGKVADLSVPVTEKGQALWDLMRQMYLDDIIARSASEMMEPGRAMVRGPSLWNNLFGPNGLGEDKVKLIFGDQASENLKALGRVLSNQSVAQRFYSNFSNTEIQRAMSNYINPDSFWALLMMPVRNAARRRVGKQIIKNQPEVLLGREFITEGKLPNIGKYMHEMGKKRPLARLLTGLGYKGPELQTLLRTAAQGAVRVPETPRNVARTVLGQQPGGQP